MASSSLSPFMSIMIPSLRSPCVSLDGKPRQSCTWWRWVLVVPGCPPDFPSWPPVIEEANWMTLDKDVPQPPEGGFDAVICLGNSFAHLPDCKGERGCGLGTALALSSTPPFPQLWVPALLPEQLCFLPLSALALASLGSRKMEGRLVLGALSRHSLSPLPGTQGTRVSTVWR